jgi:hypothetical protein
MTDDAMGGRLRCAEPEYTAVLGFVFDGHRHAIIAADTDFVGVVGGLSRRTKLFITAHAQQCTQRDMRYAAFGRLCCHQSVSDRSKVT